jgi:hypothetical protein
MKTSIEEGEERENEKNSIPSAFPRLESGGVCISLCIYRGLDVFPNDLFCAGEEGKARNSTLHSHIMCKGFPSSLNSSYEMSGERERGKKNLPPSC